MALRYTLRDRLARGEFVVTMEVEPPRGADPWPVFEKIADVMPYLTAVNIADSPTAKLRMSPIALAHLVQDRLQLETIFHLTCRDRNLLGLQAELLGAYGLGVTNILTLTGDRPEIGDHPQASGGFDVDSVGLAHMADQLNHGLDYTGRTLSDATSFFIGAVANPVLDDLSVEAARIERKIASGVQFFQTQPIYHIDQLKRFEEQAPTGVPYLYGIMPLKSAKQAHYLNANVPGVQVPEEMIAVLERDGREGGIAWCKALIEEIRPLAAGVHIFPMGDYEMAEKLVGDLWR